MSSQPLGNACEQKGFFFHRLSLSLDICTDFKIFKPALQFIFHSQLVPFFISICCILSDLWNCIFFLILPTLIFSLQFLFFLFIAIFFYGGKVKFDFIEV